VDSADNRAGTEMPNPRMPNRGYSVGSECRNG